MQPTPVDWGEAFRIVGGGLLVVFLIMSLLAVATTIMGKIFMAREAKKKAEAKAKEATA
ncbi:MAG: OadG family protein [Desulfarculaceae bacterium]|nr:OadG family protein [Desulfarculaceae bacterium]MCF8049360.1 OadG family protein [Desulfarculaceae bacterium]MCF8066313.1 OadG family protein [Desulfarculaceae bacterium]MCF8099357.1 OadG family protein [Desulfarculaceae bacterium]MCF8123392.1 OadG family protein [Desulfarculaceae bacterium]